MKVNKLIFMFVIMIDIALCAVVYSDTLTDELSQELLRLHIIANSNFAGSNVFFMVNFLCNLAVGT